MNLLFPVSLTLFIMAVQRTKEYPIELSQTDQRVPKPFGRKPVYLAPEDFDGEDMNLLKSEDKMEGAEGEQDVQKLNPDVADTMRKINPLTIADQVSQIFRKTNEKPIASRTGGVASMPQTKLAEEEGDQSLAMPAGPDVEDSLIVPGYVRQETPKIVNKPRSNDYGYSVIVLAGDAVHLPIKVQGKGVRGQERNRVEDKDGRAAQGQAIYKAGEAEEKINMEEKSPKKEVRVYKQFSKSPDFPVYDEDFNFVPDPFHGILDESYKNEVSKSDPKPVIPETGFRQEEVGLVYHKIHTRSEDDAGSANVADERVACGGTWGKSNATETEGLSPLSSTDVKEN